MCDVVDLAETHKECISGSLLLVMMMMMTMMNFINCQSLNIIICVVSNYCEQELRIYETVFSGTTF